MIYLWLNILTVLFPLILSFDKKVAYYKRWKELFPAIVLTGAFFIVWDIQFTRMGVWEFNPEYLLGIFMYGLPLEEWMFFVTVPFSSVFIYDCIKIYLSKDILKPISTPLTILIVALLAIIVFLYYDKAYTSVTCSLTAVALLIATKMWGIANMGKFYLAYFIHLIPFLLVNGVLTAMPVVIYNNSENSGIRIGTIPAEDTMYSLLLLLMNILIYEYLMKRNYYKQQLKSATT